MGSGWLSAKSYSYHLIHGRRGQFSFTLKLTNSLVRERKGIFEFCVLSVNKKSWKNYVLCLSNLNYYIHICSHKLRYHEDIILYVARNNVQEMKDKIVNIKVTFCDLYWHLVKLYVMKYLRPYNFNHDLWVHRLL